MGYTVEELQKRHDFLEAWMGKVEQIVFENGLGYHAPEVILERVAAVKGIADKMNDRALGFFKVSMERDLLRDDVDRLEEAVRKLNKDLVELANARR